MNSRNSNAQAESAIFPHRRGLRIRPPNRTSKSPEYAANGNFLGRRMRSSASRWRDGKSQIIKAAIPPRSRRIIRRSHFFVVVQCHESMMQRAGSGGGCNDLWPCRQIQDFQTGSWQDLFPPEPAFERFADKFFPRHNGQLPDISLRSLQKTNLDNTAWQIAVCISQ